MPHTQVSEGRLIATTGLDGLMVRMLAPEWQSCLFEFHSGFVCLLLFYILATSTVMSGQVPTCDSAMKILHSVHATYLSLLLMHLFLSYILATSMVISR